MCVSSSSFSRKNPNRLKKSFTRYITPLFEHSTEGSSLTQPRSTYYRRGFLFIKRETSNRWLDDGGGTFDENMDFIIWLLCVLYQLKKFFQAKLFEKTFLRCKIRFITAAISDPTIGKEVIRLEFIIWILKTIGESAILYGVHRVLDYLFKRH